MDFRLTAVNEISDTWASKLRLLGFSLFPGRCLVCGNHSGRRADLCPGCESDLPLNSNACRRCALPLRETVPAIAICGTCLADPPPHQSCIAPLRYQSPVNCLMNAFKHRGKFSAGAALAEMMLQQLHDHRELPEWLVPVPLHWRRQWLRGFNQATWLAHYLGRRLAIPVATSLLRRTRHTAPQQGQDRRHRLANLKRAFALHGPVPPAHIALVDDVVTTGSTARTLAGLLINGGATRVDVWCLARTPLEK